MNTPSIHRPKTREINQSVSSETHNTKGVVTMKKMTLLGLVGVFFIIFLGMGISNDLTVGENPSIAMEKIDFSERALVQETMSIIIVAEKTPETPESKLDADFDYYNQPSITTHGKKVLQRTDSGAEVKELQAMLNMHGANLEVDGLFGDLTRQAVIDFQLENGLLVDGFVGEQTWGELLELQEEVSQLSAEQSESDGFVAGIL